MNARGIWPKNGLVGTLLAVLLAGLMPAPGAAQTFSWVNGVGGTFGTSTNWSPPGPPGALSHTALFSIPTTSYTVSLGANHTVGTLIVSQTFGVPTFSAPGRQLSVGTLARFASNTTWNGGTLSTSLFGGSIEVGATLNVGTGSYIRSGSLLVGTPTNSGRASFNAATFLMFGGSVGQGAPGLSELSMANGSVGTFAVLDIGAPGSASTGGVNVLTNSLLNVATLQIGNQGTIATDSGMTVSGGARVTMLPDSALIVGGSTIEFFSGFPSSLGRGGTLNITANSATFSAGTPGTFSTSNAPVLVNYGGAISIGHGTLNVNGDVQCDGLITVASQGSYLAGPTQTTRVDGTSLGLGGGLFPVTTPSFTGNGTITGGTLIVGSGSTANGWATLGPASAVNFAAATVVAESGVGRLDAVTLNTPILAIGRLAGSQGTFNAGFYDTGSTTTDRSGTPVVGSAVVGDFGSAVLTVRLGSTMTVNGPTDIGLGAGSAGTISIEGAGEAEIATYAASGQRMTVGSAGAGTLVVRPFSTLNVGTLVIGPSAGGGSGAGVQTGGTVTPSSGTLQVNARGSYTLSGGTLAAVVDNLGTFTYGGGAFGGSIANAGTLALNAPLPAGAFVANAFTGRIAAADGLFAGNGTISNVGSFGGNGTLASGMTLLNDGTLTSASGDFVIETGATLANGAAGLIRNAPASTLRIRTLDFVNDGDVEVNAGGAVELAGSLDIGPGARLTLRGGLLAVAGAGDVGVAAGGTVVGFGQVNGDVTNAGSVQFNGPTQLLGALINNAGINIRNASTIVYGPATNNGSITVQNGTIIFEQALTSAPADGLGGSIDGAGVATVLPGGRLVTDAVRQDVLELAGTGADHALAVLRPASAGGVTSVVDVLTIAGSPGAYFGRLDLSDNALIVDYAGESPTAAMVGYLATGYAGGSWGGGGVTSSVAQAVASSSDPIKTALGVGLSSDILGGAGVFRGEAVDATAVLVTYTFAGDASLDGQVDVTDLGRLATNWQGSGIWSGGDFSYDGLVNVTDLGILATNWQAGVPGPVDPAATLHAALQRVGLAVVPEPGLASLALLAFGAFAARRR